MSAELTTVRTSYVPFQYNAPFFPADSPFEVTTQVNGFLELTDPIAPSSFVSLIGSPTLVSFDFRFNGTDLGLNELGVLNEFTIGTDAAGSINYWDILIRSSSSIIVEGREYTEAAFAAESFNGIDRGDALFLGNCVNNCSGEGGVIGGNAAFTSDQPSLDQWSGPKHVDREVPEIDAPLLVQVAFILFCLYLALRNARSSGLKLEHKSSKINPNAPSEMSAFLS